MSNPTFWTTFPGVLKRLTRKDTKQTLNFAKIGLDVGSAKVTSTAVNDVSNTANSMGLPAAQCGNVICTFYHPGAAV